MGLTTPILKSEGVGVILYVVDYDVPVKARKSFYRRLSKILRGSCHKSTKSVVITPSFKVADEVRRLALEHGGRAHLYRAVRLS